MDRRQAMRYVMMGFMVAVIYITYRDFKSHNGMPTPGEFWGAGVVYGMAGVISELAPGLGGALAIGWTIGLLFNIVPTSAPFKVPPLTGQQEAAQRVRAQQGGNI